MACHTVVPYSQVDCPYPLRYNRDEEDSFAESDYDGQVMCVMPCPNPMWTDSEWNGGIVAMMIVSGISFLLATCLVLFLPPPAAPNFTSSPTPLDAPPPRIAGGDPVHAPQQAPLPRHTLHLHRTTYYYDYFYYFYYYPRIVLSTDTRLAVGGGFTVDLLDGGGVHGDLLSHHLWRPHAHGVHSGTAGSTLPRAWVGFAALFSKLTL